MMILCPSHHDQASKGAMPEEVQQRHKADPYNIRKGYTYGQLVVNQSYCAVEVGGVLLVGDGPWVSVDDEVLLSLKLADNGVLLVSVTLYNERDKLLAEVIDNEWVAGNPAIWDMESDWQSLTLRLGPRKIALKVDAKGEPLRLRGELWHRGNQIRLTHSGLRFGREGRSSIESLGLAQGGLRIDSAAGTVQLGPAGDDSMMLVSDPDPLVRLEKTVAAYHQLQTGQPSLIRRPSS